MRNCFEKMSPREREFRQSDHFMKMIRLFIEILKSWRKCNYIISTNFPVYKNAFADDVGSGASSGWPFYVVKASTSLSKWQQPHRQLTFSSNLFNSNECEQVDLASTCFVGKLLKVTSRRFQWLSSTCRWDVTSSCSCTVATCMTSPCFLKQQQ